eukprot:gene14801-biopygen12604
MAEGPCRKVRWPASIKTGSAKLTYHHVMYALLQLHTFVVPPGAHPPRELLSREGRAGDAGEECDGLRDVQVCAVFQATSDLPEPDIPGDISAPWGPFLAPADRLSGPSPAVPLRHAGTRLTIASGMETMTTRFPFLLVLHRRSGISPRQVFETGMRNPLTADSSRHGGQAPDSGRKSREANEALGTPKPQNSGLISGPLAEPRAGPGRAGLASSFFKVMINSSTHELRCVADAL